MIVLFQVVPLSQITILTQRPQVLWDGFAAFGNRDDMIDMEFYTVLSAAPADLAAEAIPFEDTVPEFVSHQRPFMLTLDDCIGFLLLLLDQVVIARDNITKRIFLLSVIAISPFGTDIGYAQFYHAVAEGIEFIPLEKLFFDMDIPLKRNMQARCFFWGNR